MEIKNFTPRLYQETILESCIKKNTLVVLPTGMGKTKVAIMTAVKRMNQYPSSRVLFLTPTKPLASQIQREFKECTDVDPDEVVLFTGEILPAKREKLAKDAKVIISTPQTISNDVVNDRLDLNEYSLLVLDEAHRCVKDYAYTWIAKSYMKKARYPRILGLTASPGSDMQSITHVCKNAFIEEIEIRTDQDPDVKEYIQEIDIETVKVDLPKEYKEVQEFLTNCFDDKILGVKKLGMISKMEFSKKELIGTMAGFQGRLARGDKDFRVLRSVSLFAEALKVQHAIELLETQGAKALLGYLEKTFGEAEKTKTKAIQRLVKDLNFSAALVKTRKLVEDDVKHPKLLALKNLVEFQIKENPHMKMIIFNQYRDSAKTIEKELNDIEGINASIFVGQMKKLGTGLSQKEQIALLKEFSEGIRNIIISTSIGEEGLDIPKVDLVVFYEPIPSAIRSIQRRGRTARTEKGKVVMFLTKNTRDEAYHWVAHHKERNMHRVLNQMKEKLIFKEKERQPTLNDFGVEAEEFHIQADSRETNSNVVKELVNQGIKVTTKNLNVADYIISDKVGIERKTIKDFLASMIDRRLLQQLKSLRENFEKPLIILEGDEDIYSVRRIHPNAIRGMLATITVSYSIPIVRTENSKDTALLIRAIVKREQTEAERGISLRVERKPLSTKEQQEYIVESLPGVGPIIAKNILSKFKSVKNVFDASEKDLKEVENLGAKKAKEIRNLIDEEY